MKVLDVFLVSVPEAPSQVSVATIMETSLQVSWRRSNALDLVLQYAVQIKSGAGDWEQVNDTIQGSSVLVKNLNSFTVYSFRVSAENGLGTSPYSQPSPNVTTLEGGTRKDFRCFKVIIDNNDNSTTSLFFHITSYSLQFLKFRRQKFNRNFYEI